MIKEMGKVIQSSTRNHVCVMNDLLGNEKKNRLVESTQYIFDAINKCEARKVKLEDDIDGMAEVEDKKRKLKYISKCAKRIDDLYDMLQ